LVFASNAAAELSTAALDIQLFDLKTQQVSTLPNSEGLYSPRWSPEGSYIAALKAGLEFLWLYDIKTQKWRELARVAVGYPSWSRDGKYIYFDSESAFFRVRISDRKLERVIGLKDLLDPHESWAPWTGLTPDDSPLLSKNVGTEEIYALDWEAP
jgi:eukaryotic-like serine/threonine-protein kinase